MSPCFALVDCNSFYANCERLFRPDLKHTPVVVLSNNDGCVVAASPEAKALGVPMAAPFFKVKKTLKQHGVVVFSSNYALYADISNRVMETLEQLSPNVEIYSIDEAFLDLSNLGHVDSLDAYGRQIKHTVEKNVGIPVGVGIAPTKTLAKLANHLAKRHVSTGGVVDLSQARWRQRALAITPVGDVWGIGRGLARQLQHIGIHTAEALAKADSSYLRRRFSIVLSRTQQELNGISCLALDALPNAKQHIICSRSFGQRITHYCDMREAVASYTVRAAEKLRAEGQQCQMLGIFIRTSHHDKAETCYANSLNERLGAPTADSRVLAQTSARLLKAVWKEGYRYAKAGVVLNEFSPAGKGQLHLFHQHDPAKAAALMKTMDVINQQGKGRVQLASQGFKQNWHMHRNYLSPAYTSSWDAIPQVN